MQIFWTIFLFLPCFWGCESRTSPFYKGKSRFSQGIYHKVKHGETLWSISKKYGIALKDISRSNRISSLDKIHIHQLLFIPVAQKPAFEKYVQKEALSTKNAHGLFGFPLDTPFHDCKKFLQDRGLNITTKAHAHVFAAASGHIIFNDHVKAMGHVILMKHKNGYTTVYGHLDKTFFKKDDWVPRGTNIGILKERKGHEQSILRFEIRKKGIRISPVAFFL